MQPLNPHRLFVEMDARCTWIAHRRLDQPTTAHGRPLHAHEVAMSDSQTPNDNPERESISFGPAPVNADAPQAAPQQHDSGASADVAPGSGAHTDEPERRSQGPSGVRKLVWALVALVCVAAGVVGSVLGAHAIARSDSTKSRQSAQQTSAAVASNVKLALRHEETSRSARPPTSPATPRPRPRNSRRGSNGRRRCGAIPNSRASAS